jgi:hypothetical protein
MKKFCTGCETELDISEFHPNNTKHDGLQTQCKKCRALYNKEHYKKNRDIYVRRRDLHRKETQDFLRDFKKKSKCKECGEDRWVCLDFHHRDPEEKNGNLYELSNKQGYSIARLQEEINKCDILCANCHRVLHWG